MQARDHFRLGDVVMRRHFGVGPFDERKVPLPAVDDLPVAGVEQHVRLPAGARGR